jgi:FkbM family methyltransferase
MLEMLKVIRYKLAVIADIFPHSISQKIIRTTLQYYQGIGSGETIKYSGEIRFLKKTLTKGKPNLIYDVGGNLGDFSNAVLLQNPEASIYVFEPARECVEHLRNCFVAQENITIMDIGISGREGKASFLTGHKFSGSSRIDSGKEDFQFVDRYEVEINTIDNIHKNADHDLIDILKIDVEGGEFDVIKGAIQTLRTKKINNLLFEFGGGNGRPKYFFYEIYDFLKNIGYSTYRLTPGGRLIPITYDARIDENHICTLFVAKPSEE